MYLYIYKKNPGFGITKETTILFENSMKIRSNIIKINVCKSSNFCILKSVISRPITNLINFKIRLNNEQLFTIVNNIYGFQYFELIFYQNEWKPSQDAKISQWCNVTLTVHNYHTKTDFSMTWYNKNIVIHCIITIVVYVM